MNSAFNLTWEAMCGEVKSCAPAAMSDDAGYRPPDDSRHPSDTNAPDEPLVDEDARLVVRLRNGDVDAFTAVFRSYYSALATSSGTDPRNADRHQYAMFCYLSCDFAR
jgi:hypothetical protein